MNANSPDRAGGGATMTLMNGQARDTPAAAAMVPLAVPPVRQAGPASHWPPPEPCEGITAEVAKAAGNAAGGDRLIRLLTAAVVLTVAAIAAVVSYSHIFALGRAHGQDGTAARLLPLSVDGLIAAASLVMLHAARNDITLRKMSLSRIMLGLGVGATVAANVFYGLPFGWLGAVVSAWPAVAFVGSVEMAVKFVRDARAVATAAADGATELATVSAADDGAPCDIASDAGRDENVAEPAPDLRQESDSDVRQISGRRAPRTPRRTRQKAPSGSDKARDIMRRNPGLPKADVARRAGVSVRTVERIMSDMETAR